MNDIDDAIAAWHDDETIAVALHEYLGMTWEQYGKWFVSGQLPDGSPYTQAGDRQ